MYERLKDGEWTDDGWHKTGSLRGPKPIDLGTYVLENHEFRYDVLDLGSRTRETACNIVPKQGARTYGVVYRVTNEQLNILDKEEDVPRNYRRVALKVQVVADNVFNPDVEKSPSELEVWAYMGQPEFITDNWQPDPEYVELLESSARKRGNIPEGYSASS